MEENLWRVYLYRILNQTSWFSLPLITPWNRELEYSNVYNRLSGFLYYNKQMALYLPKGPSKTWFLGQGLQFRDPLLY